MLRRLSVLSDMETADKNGKKLWLPSWRGVIITLLVGSNIIFIRIIEALIHKGHLLKALCVNSTQTLADPLHGGEIRMMELKKQLCVDTRGQPAGCAVCPVGWLWHRESCYYFSAERDDRTWSESREMCARMGADLLIIEDLEEKEFIKRSIRIQGYDLFWIGAHRDGDGWRWVDGQRYDTGLFQPSGESSGNCIWLEADAGYDMDDCQSKRSWICEKRALKI